MTHGVTVLCYVHQQTFPKASCHVHHEMPQAAGGGDEAENLTWVCANCHNMIHRCADAIVGGRMGVATDLAMQYAPNVPALRERLVRLAGYAADAMKTASEDPEMGANDVTIQVVLPKEIAQRLKLLVADRRVNGKRVSTQAFLKAMILQQLQKANLLPPKK